MPMPSTSTTATFRGRVAESGDEKQAAPEPKLSWEFRQCVAADVSPKTDPSDDETDGIDIANATATNDSSDRTDDIFGLLPKWTEALHSVAAAVVDLLDVPPRLALQENPCQCRPNASNDVVRRRGRCNIDLLRVFRYDALPPQGDDDATSTTMGSSPHTDWGTLTVVWQDGKGGLHTHCHACDMWSDVDAGPPSNDGEPNEKRAASLFVHVGDFLGLATAGRGGGPPAWPSPRHRVLCPVRERSPGDGATGAGDDCRRSLVYFAYPPPGVSLEDARRAVAPLALRSPSADDSRADETAADDSARFYDRHSLLHDQSHQPSQAGENTRGSGGDDCGAQERELASFRTHEQIRGVSFDEVIFEKWNQVQRKAATT